MNGTHIASIMIGTIFGLTILGALLGLARKWKKALLRFGLIVVEFISALTMSGKISQYITADMVVEWLGTDSLISELLLNVPSLYTVSLGLIRPILFVLCFIAFSIVSLLLYWIIALFLRYKPEEKTFPMAAMMIGAVQGLLVALVLISPVIGYVTLADQAAVAYTDVVGEKLPDKIESIHRDYVKPIKDHELIKAVGSMTSPIFNAVVSFDLGTETLIPSKEIPLLLSGYTDVMSLKDVDFSDYGPDEKATIKDLTTTFGQSTLLPHIGAEALSAIATAWQNGESFMGIDPFTIEGDFSVIIDSLYTLFSTSSPGTLTADITTIGDFLILMIDYNATSLLSGDDDVLAKITEVNPATGKTFIKAATELLDANPHMAILRAGITKLGANLLGSQLGTSEEIRENYGDMVTSVVDILKDVEGTTNEEKIEALTPTIKEELLKNEIDLSDELVDEASRFLLEELEKDNVEIETMTEEDIYNILDKIAAGEIIIPLP